MKSLPYLIGTLMVFIFVSLSCQYGLVQALRGSNAGASSGKKAENGVKFSSGRLTLGEKYSAMKEYKEARGKDSSLIHISSQNYRRLIFSSPKNYSTFVMFFDYSLDHCPKLCRNALVDFEYIAKGYYHQQEKKAIHEPDSLFFVTVDIGQGENEYRKFKLDMYTTIPNFFYFPKTNISKYNPFMKMSEEYNEEMNAKSIVEWIYEVSEIYIDLRKVPNNEESNLMYLTTLLLGGSFILHCIRKGSVDVIYQDICNINYAHYSVILVLWLSSGQMYNIIRGTPFSTYSRDGSIRLIASHHRDQYTGESCIVMFLYGLIVYGMIELIEMKTPKPKLESNQIVEVEEKSFQIFDLHDIMMAKSVLPIVVGLLSISLLYKMKS